jgi:hypothetical protein
LATFLGGRKEYYYDIADWVSDMEDSKIPEYIRRWIERNNPEPDYEEENEQIST